MAIRAIFYLLLAMFLVAIQDSLFKQLTQDYPVLQLLFTRMCIVVFTFTAVYLLRRKTLSLKASQWPLIAGRGICAFVAFFLYYMALQRAGLAEAATVLMSAPLFVTALSVPLLGEKVGVHRWGAVCVGFIAVAIMLRPGSDLFQPIMILPVISAFIYSLLPIITRHINADTSTFAVTYLTTVAYWVVSALTAVAVHVFPATAQSWPGYQAIAEPWHALSLNAALILTLCAVIFMVVIFMITFAYRQAQVSAIASIEYTYLVWAMLIGYVMFDESPGLLTYFAALVIIGCGFYIALREHRVESDLVATRVERS